jgi:serine protease Do
MTPMRIVRTSVWLGAWLTAAALIPLSAAGKEASAGVDLARKLNQAFIEVADSVSPAVVVIDVAHKPDYDPQGDEDNPFWDFLPPQFRRQMEERFRERQRRNRAPVFDAQGSGVVIREDGYILTNRHVVDGAEKVRVRFKSGKEYAAEVRGVDAQSDVAVLKIDAKNLPIARFGDSNRVRVGEFAVAIGAPFELDYSVTVGHVSAKGRSRVIPDPAMEQDFIQTDASINPGNSGGPLVNIDGEVIGINTLIRGLRTGIGFAIPSNLAKEVADKLISEGKFTRAWLGVEIISLSEYPEFREWVDGVEEGVVVRGIRQDGPAAKSDLKPRDVITAVDGHPVATAQQLRNEIRLKPLSKEVALDVVRGGKRIVVKVKPEEWPDDAQPVLSKRPSPAEAESTDLGLTVKPMTKELAKEFGVTMAEGLLVTEVVPGGLAHRKGVQRGDIITEINEISVSTLSDYRNALRKADLKKGVIANLISQGVSKFVLLKDAGD